MTIVYVLTPDLRVRLKTPLGILIRGSFAETVKVIKEMIRKENPATIVSVGDTVSRNLAQSNVLPRLSIVDNRVMRKAVQPTALPTEKTVHIKNPPGLITKEAVEAVRDAFETKSRIKVVVDGEEDLLALVAVMYSPDNSFIIYGQPHEGVVVIRTTPKKRAEIAEILQTMEDAAKAK